MKSKQSPIQTLLGSPFLGLLTNLVFAFLTWFSIQSYPAFVVADTSYSELGVYSLNSRAIFFNLGLCLFSAGNGLYLLNIIKNYSASQRFYKNIRMLIILAFGALFLAGIFPCHPNPFRFLHLGSAWISMMFLYAGMGIFSYILYEKRKRLFFFSLVILCSVVVGFFLSPHSSGRLGAPETIGIIGLGVWEITMIINFYSGERFFPKRN